MRGGGETREQVRARGPTTAPPSVRGPAADTPTARVTRHTPHHATPGCDVEPRVCAVERVTRDFFGVKGAQSFRTVKRDRAGHTNGNRKNAARRARQRRRERMHTNAKGISRSVAGLSLSLTALRSSRRARAGRALRRIGPRRCAETENPASYPTVRAAERVHASGPQPRPAPTARATASDSTSRISVASPVHCTPKPPSARKRARAQLVQQQHAQENWLAHFESIASSSHCGCPSCVDTRAK